MTAATVAVACASASASSAGSVSIVFQGSYVLTAQASQPSYKPASQKCVPGVTQKETASVRWTMRFVARSLPTSGSVTLDAKDVAFSGTHLWDEASVMCAAYPAGRLVCRTHYVEYPQSLLITVADGEITFHPQVVLDAVSDGDACKGQVYNEHPDCGARDAAAVTDFAFTGELRADAARLGSGQTKAPFDVQQTRSCRHAGVRNPGMIQQEASTRYRGTFTLLLRG